MGARDAVVVTRMLAKASIMGEDAPASDTAAAAVPLPEASQKMAVGAESTSGRKKAHPETAPETEPETDEYEEEEEEEEEGEGDADGPRSVASSPRTATAQGGAVGVASSAGKSFQNSLEPISIANPAADDGALLLIGHLCSAPGRVSRHRYAERKRNREDERHEGKEGQKHLS